MPTGVYNADGSDGGLHLGLGETRVNVVYLGGPHEADEGRVPSGGLLPSAPVVMTDGGDWAYAADNATECHGILLENDHKADQGTVLDAWAEGKFARANIADGGRHMGTVTLPATTGSLAVGEMVVSDGAGKFKPAGVGVTGIAKYIGKTDLANVTGSAVDHQVALQYIKGGQ